MCDDDSVVSAPASLAQQFSASERAEIRRQKILAKGAERMSKVSGLYPKASSDAIGSSPRDAVLERAASASEYSSSAVRDEFSSPRTDVAAAAPADAEAIQSSSQVDNDTNPVIRARSAQDCELPSVRALLHSSERPSRTAAPMQRAPGVRSFQPAASTSAVASNSARTSHPTSRRFFLWHAAAWTVAAAFCAAVCAHTLQLLPPAPYVLLLFVVIARRKGFACSAEILTLAQAMAAVVALSRFTVRALAYQASNALRSFDMCSFVCACIRRPLVCFLHAL